MTVATIDAFSESTKTAIKHYVYALADDRDRIFYVGKGRGNRVFDHVNEVRKLRRQADGMASAKALDEAEEDLLASPADPRSLSSPESLPEQSSSSSSSPTDILGRKRQKIFELLERGVEPRKYVIWEGITEGPLALIIESILISVLNWQLSGQLTEEEASALTNKQGGHGASHFGLKTVEELEATKGDNFNIEDLPELDQLRGCEVVAININRRWTELVSQNGSLYDASRGDWKMSLDRATSCRYVIVHSNNVVRGVFRADGWERATVEGRVRFTTNEQLPLSNANLSNKNASSLFGPGGSGSQNPVRYVVVPKAKPPVM